MHAAPHDSRRWTILVLLCAAVAASGCTARTLTEAFSMHSDRPDPREEEKHRREYMATHSRVSMQWLLANCVDSGMSYNDVCRVLGEQGAHEPRDNWVKTKHEVYQLGDDVYCFGPDSEGRSLYLVFREDVLVNFDPDEFRTSSRKPADD